MAATGTWDALINVELEQSNSWLPKENLTLQPNGAFSYSGELTEAQKIIMTMNQHYLAPEIMEHEIQTEGYTIKSL